MKRYVKSTEDIYGMSRVGQISGNGVTFEIYVNTNDGGKIPHFHMRDIDDWDNFHTCIRIDAPKYFLHGSKQDILSAKEKKLLADFMEAPTRKALFNEKGQRINNWQYVCMLWDDNNSDVMIDESVEQPDYRQLS